MFNCRWKITIRGSIMDFDVEKLTLTFARMIEDLKDKGYEVDFMPVMIVENLEGTWIV